MDTETEIRRIKRLGLNLEKLEKEIENNKADCFEFDAILKKVNKNYANFLPKIKLPIFDGKIENWISFSNIFKTTIIDNSQLTNIVKLQYLKTCLKRKALVLINHIPITKNNFVLAWGNYAKALNTSETEKGLPLIKRFMKLQVHNLTKANCFLCQQRSMESINAQLF
ncbi:hypothetical protein LAZ67_22000720 [Cordylochernes scorpioides]|uniref:Uncharacterized protein n=1 Tax=Cordylochernes scorpioides TaxID=51811 RepID=A0ABY6LNU9_9ARAC|nr:hypothetical protein LAZ67_22000720 [Cordylochernes scorpioides]